MNLFPLFLAFVLVSCAEKQLPCTPDSLGKELSWDSGKNSCTGRVSGVFDKSVTVLGRTGVAVFECREGFIDESPVIQNCKRSCPEVKMYSWGSGPQKCEAHVSALAHNSTQLLKSSQYFRKISGQVFLVCVNGIWIEDAEKTSCEKVL